MLLSKPKVLIQNLIVCYLVGVIIGALLFIWTNIRMKILFQNQNDHSCDTSANIKSISVLNLI